jgi:amidase
MRKRLDAPNVSDRPATRTAVVNARVLAAGGIPHARSATPEFSCAYYTHSRRWGLTRNPWRPDTAPGGSSGGAAAALAAGSTTLATGSDIAGSIREPAARCGVVGYKPPYGRVPQDAPFNLDTYCHAGPMTRSVADGMLMQNVLAGPDSSDPACLPESEPLAEAPGDLTGWRIAWSPDLGAFRADPEVVGTARRALAVFEDLGAEIEEVRLPWTPAMIAAGWAHLRLGFGQWIARQAKTQGALMTGYALRFAEAARSAGASDHLASLAAAAEMHAALAPVMARCRLLVAPATACAAIPADYAPERHALAIEEQAIGEFDTAMTLPFNMLSRHPVLSVPAGHTAAGSPVGLQLVGRLLADGDVFRAGLAYEAAVGGWYRRAADRPRIPAQDREQATPPTPADTEVTP